MLTERFPPSHNQPQNHVTETATMATEQQLKEAQSLIVAANVLRVWHQPEKARAKLNQALELVDDKPRLKQSILTELGRPDCQPGNCKCGCCI